jgi:UDP-N-acetylglucosamine 2-epimerase (hydrolysing)
MRVLTVFGTRPEAIKLAPVIKELDARSGVEQVLCVTAQHRQLLDQVLDVFEIEPAYDLNVMRESLTLDQIASRILDGLSGVFDAVRPDYVIVQGDTASTFCGAIASFHRQIPVGHVEAGLRTGDLGAPWPEEMYRRVVDGVSDLMWAPTQTAAQALAREGAASERVIVTGNTVVDALLYATAVIDRDAQLQEQISARLSFLTPGERVILVTGHRRESFDGGLAEVCAALDHIAGYPGIQLVWPVHPNPIVARTIKSALGRRDNIHLIGPLDYMSFLELMRRCHLIITDSGGIQEEAPSFGKPVIVTRTHTERQEAVLSGSAIVTGADRRSIISEVDLLLNDDAAYGRRARIPNPFGDGAAAVRIIDSLLARLDALRSR